MPGRLSSLFARRARSLDGAAVSREAEPEADSAAAMPPRSRRPVSPERERRELLRRREIEIRDVGGLVLEMARRDSWRPELLASRASEVLALEERIQELEAILAASEIAARGLGAHQCRCGAPVLRGAHFCSHCGRPAEVTPPIVACERCGQPLPADVNFCPACGNAIAAGELARSETPDATAIRSPAPGEGRPGGP
jgi:hypothetical protein